MGGADKNKNDKNVKKFYNNDRAEYLLQKLREFHSSNPFTESSPIKNRAVVSKYMTVSEQAAS